MANFKKAVEIVFKNEGYDQIVTDTGGLTKWGISAKAHPNVDIRNLTKADAEAIYKEKYWDVIKGDQITDQANAEAIFDHAVNAGPGEATKLAQDSLNALGFNLKVDGGLGPLTLNALNKVDSFTFLPQYLYRRTQFYMGLASSKPQKYAKYLKGWIKRVESFKPTEVVTYLPLLGGIAILTYLFMRNKK
ncbi:MAG: glycosyl hydrolase 108 family protein [Eudoraea sp.]|nr:glycosyl hydrolase 108 family protein [Eudoraea sp.]